MASSLEMSAGGGVGSSTGLALALKPLLLVTPFAFASMMGVAWIGGLMMLVSIFDGPPDPISAKLLIILDVLDLRPDFDFDFGIEMETLLLSVLAVTAVVEPWFLPLTLNRCWSVCMSNSVGVRVIDTGADVFNFSDPSTRLRVDFSAFGGGTGGAVVGAEVLWFELQLQLLSQVDGLGDGDGGTSRSPFLAAVPTTVSKLRSTPAFARAGAVMGLWNAFALIFPVSFLGFIFGLGVAPSLALEVEVMFAPVPDPVPVEDLDLTCPYLPLPPAPSTPVVEGIGVGAGVGVRVGFDSAPVLKLRLRLWLSRLETSSMVSRPSLPLLALPSPL